MRVAVTDVVKSCEEIQKVPLRGQRGPQPCVILLKEGPVFVNDGLEVDQIGVRIGILPLRIFLAPLGAVQPNREGDAPSPPPLLLAPEVGLQAASNVVVELALHLMQQRYGGRCCRTLPEMICFQRLADEPHEPLRQPWNRLPQVHLGGVVFRPRPMQPLAPMDAPSNVARECPLADEGVTISVRFGAAYRTREAMLSHHGLPL